MPRRMQFSHSGNVSGHFTLRLLQLMQPFLDFVWPFRGPALPRTVPTTKLVSGDEPEDVFNCIVSAIIVDDRTAVALCVA
jgi:hypothetical protein